ncbi:MAG: prepilin-type N-terminal cleavage/methylation domain-containing protein [Candidatus Aminicenantes bacterium]|jgi:general secretion pathway protein G|nr:prepilin-type N-terminal cleavage/methylation domain-containing protein [Candidatus Aminicenantes bacterium]
MKNQRQKGFTLIEMMIVFALLGILVGLGLPQYTNATKRAREAVLKEDLFLMRKLIGQYYLDKGQYPASLQTLVDDGYLFRIPVDPITRTTDSWFEFMEVLTEEDLVAGVQPGISDVRSGSYETSLDGTLYSTW